VWGSFRSSKTPRMNSRARNISVSLPMWGSRRHPGHGHLDALDQHLADCLRAPGGVALWLEKIQRRAWSTSQAIAFAALSSASSSKSDQARARAAIVAYLAQATYAHAANTCTKCPRYFLVETPRRDVSRAGAPSSTLPRSRRCVSAIDATGQSTAPPPSVSWCRDDAGSR
jgi:hypothetical protein